MRKQLLERIRQNFLLNGERILEEMHQDRLAKEAHRKEKIEAHRPRMRDRQLQQLYGFGLEHYNHVLARQGGVCEICGLPPMGSDDVLQVDHCHKTDLIRDLLCKCCNLAVAHYERDHLGPTHPLFGAITRYVKEYHYIAAGI